MHWITVIGIILIAAGTVLTYIGQNISSKSDVDSLQKSISDKNARIEHLVKGNDELLEKIDKYQTTIAEKEQEIDQLEKQVEKLNLTAPKLLPDGRIEASPGIVYQSKFSDNANKARNLFNKGKLEEAYKLAQELKDNNPEFGLAFFLLGTIEIQKGDILKGKRNLEHSITLELTNSDKAWAFHNIAIANLRENNVQECITYLKKAIEVDPNMEESKKTLKHIEDEINRYRGD